MPFDVQDALEKSNEIFQIFLEGIPLIFLSVWDKNKTYALI